MIPEYRDASDVLRDLTSSVIIFVMFSKYYNIHSPYICRIVTGQNVSRSGRGGGGQSL